MAHTATYDAAGNRVTMDRDGAPTRYAYDDADQLLSTAPGWPEELFTSALAPVGQPPFSADALVAELPLVGHQYLVEQANVSLVTGGTLDAANCWELALEARDARLGLVERLGAVGVSWGRARVVSGASA